MTNRRGFLVSCGAVAATTWAAPWALLAQAAESITTPWEGDSLRKADFGAMLNSSFYLHDAEAAHQSKVKLIRVLGYPSQPGLEQFRVILRGPAETRLPAGLYTASSWNRAPFLLYIKPTSGNDRRQLYVADFSLLL